MASTKPDSLPAPSDGALARAMLEVHIDASSCNTPPRAASPSSSQGSWVLDPEEGGWDGWDGLGASLTPSVCTPLRQTGHQQQQSQLSPLPSSVWTPTLESSPLRSWARVPQSSSAARYPTATSPPRSPSSARSCSSNSSGKAASEGLVGLARDEILEEIEILEAPTTCPSVSPPSRVVRSRQKACSGEESVGYPEIVDLDILDVGALSSPPNKNAIGPAVVVAAGMSTAETIEAIAEAGQLRQALMDKSPSPSRVVIPHEAFSSTINGSSSTPSEDAYKKRSVDAPPAQASNRTALPPTSRSDLIPAATSITTTETTPREALLPSPSQTPCVPMDVTVEIDGMRMGGIDNEREERYDGKQLDRLWRWTGIITAAKMGVIPIIICATVAALSTQTSGGGESGRADRSSGESARGGGDSGGGMRCSDRRRSRPQGGGGGADCFPGIGTDQRSLYGCVPMPYCIAPSVTCA